MRDLLRRCWIAVTVLMLARQAFAHGDAGSHATPDEGGPWTRLLWNWPFEPLVLLSLAATAWLYACGVRRLWNKAGVEHGVRRHEVACFAAGWLTLAVALASPLHPWGNELFAAHMLQHELLMLAAAPLLMLGKPAAVLPNGFLPGCSNLVVSASRWPHLRAAFRAAMNPLVAWFIHAATLWIWHVPSLFHAALHNEVIHAVQHASFFGSALLFWQAVFQRGAGALGYGAGVLYMFTTAVHSGLLGGLITLAGSVWYPDYLESSSRWGLSPLEDQQLGGAVMWIPACSVYIVAGLALFASWMQASEDRVRRREQLRQPLVPTPGWIQSKEPQP